VFHAQQQVAFSLDGAEKTSILFLFELCKAAPSDIDSEQQIFGFESGFKQIDHRLGEKRIVVQEPRYRRFAATKSPHKSAGRRIVHPRQNKFRSFFRCIEIAPVTQQTIAESES